jgi:hypothetical protein
MDSEEEEFRERQTRLINSKLYRNIDSKKTKNKKNDVQMKLLGHSSLYV